MIGAADDFHRASSMAGVNVEGGQDNPVVLQTSSDPIVGDGNLTPRAGTSAVATAKISKADAKVEVQAVEWTDDEDEGSVFRG